MIHFSSDSSPKNTVCEGATWRQSKVCPQRKEHRVTVTVAEISPNEMPLWLVN